MPTNRPPSLRSRVFWWAIVLSALGHVGAFVWVAATTPSADVAVPIEPPTPLDGLGGATIGIGAVPGAESVYEVEALEGPAAPAAPAAPATPAPPSPAAPPKAPAEPRARPNPVAVKAPKPAPGESDDPYEAVDAEREKLAKIAGKNRTESAVPGEGDAAAAGGPASPAAGELGGRGGAGDLGRALTRALPAANQGDGSWRELEGAFSASLDVRFPIDAEGRVGGFEPLAEAPAPRLVKLVRRTLALVMGGTFALRSDTVGAGAQIVRFVVRVAPPAEAPAGPQALAFEYENGHGTASFVSDGGARVEVHVEVLRVEIR